MRPITIADLQESSENYKRLYEERKLKYMAETEATEEEFLMREFDLWDNCVHMLNLEKKYHDTDWYALDRDYVQVLVEGITSMGFDKIYYPSQRKLEYVESLKTIVKKTSHTSVNLPSVPAQPQHLNQEANTKSVDEKFVAKVKPKSSSEYYLRSICIAIFCMGITVDSVKGEKLLQKHIGNSSPPSLKNNVISNSSEITSISENPHEDKWRRIFIKEAKRLVTAEKNQKGIQAITEYQKAFEANLESYRRRITG